jgi:hypothetical protein
MFGWFRPVCPCDPAAKRWVEERLAWLSRQFGLHILLERPVILPAPEFFPDPWDASQKAGRRMFRRVCGYMGVDPDSVKLQFFIDRTSTMRNFLDPSQGMAVGTWSPGQEDWQKGIVPAEESGPYDTPFLGPEKVYQKGIIRIEKSALEGSPSDLVGTMAHELSHQLLLGEGRLDRDAFDNEMLTDLTAVFHGFGVFLANNPRKSTGKLSYWPGTKLRKPEYISEPMLGYALAHLAWHREEHRPAWVKHLRWAPHAVYKQGLHYQEKTADSGFRPVRLRQVSEKGRS